MKNLPSPWFYNTFFCKKFTVSRKKKRFSHLQDFLLGIGKYIDRAVENFRFSYHASVVRGENHCRHSSKLDWTNYVRKRLMLFLRAYKYIHKDTNGVMYEVGMCNWLNWSWTGIIKKNLDDILPEYGVCVQIFLSTNYEHAKAKSLILCRPNSHPNPK